MNITNEIRQQLTDILSIEREGYFLSTSINPFYVQFELGESRPSGYWRTLLSFKVEDEALLIPAAKVFRELVSKAFSLLDSDQNA